MSEREVVLCGEPDPGGWNPCPLEAGHDGECLYWEQTRPHGRGRNGVTVINGAGERVLHISFDGPAKAEEVCAILALAELAAKEMRQERGAA